MAIDPSVGCPTRKKTALSPHQKLLYSKSGTKSNLLSSAHGRKARLTGPRNDPSGGSGSEREPFGPKAELLRNLRSFIARSMLPEVSFYPESIVEYAAAEANQLRIEQRRRAYFV